MAMATDLKTLHIQLSMAQGNALKHEDDKKAAESALALVNKELESHTKASQVLQAEHGRLKEDNENLQKKIQLQIDNNNPVIKEMNSRQPLEAELNASREERDRLKKERDSLMRVAGDLQSELKASKEAQQADITPEKAKKENETQSFFDTARRSKAAETTIPESQVQEMVERAKQDLLAQATGEVQEIVERAERAKQDLLAQATEEVKEMKYNWDCMMSQKDAELADAHAANRNLYAETLQLKSLNQNSNDNSSMFLMKEAQFCNIKKAKEGLEEELKAARKAHNDLKLDFEYQKIKLKEAKELAAQNGAGWQEEKRLRQEADLRESKTYLDMKEAWAEMQAHFVKCGQADNRRIAKERPKIRSTPPNPRQRSQSPPTVEPSPTAAPARNSDASTPPFRFMPPYNHPPPAVTSKPAKLDTPKAIANNNTPSIKKRKRQEEEDTLAYNHPPPAVTSKRAKLDTPKTTAKNNTPSSKKRKRQEEEDALAAERAPKFFKVFGVVTAIGIFTTLGEKGYLW